MPFGRTKSWKPIGSIKNGGIKSDSFEENSRKNDNYEEQNCKMQGNSDDPAKDQVIEGLKYALSEGKKALFTGNLKCEKYL